MERDFLSLFDGQKMFQKPSVFVFEETNCQPFCLVSSQTSPPLSSQGNTHVQGGDERNQLKEYCYCSETINDTSVQAACSFKHTQLCIG